jgi:hypothetical protein
MHGFHFGHFSGGAAIVLTVLFVALILGVAGLFGGRKS